mgnify:CR=1 FL=1
MLKIGRHDPEENESGGVWHTELPPDLVGMMMNSRHADIGVSRHVPWLTKFIVWFDVITAYYCQHYGSLIGLSALLYIQLHVNIRNQSQYYIEQISYLELSQMSVNT